MNNINKLKEITKNDDSNENIEVWEDLVSIKELVLSLIVCSAITLGAYFLAPKERPKQLFFGLVGAIIGFIICTIFIKPKRILIETDKEN